MRTGVCYYPEQWPSSRWATDAAMMVDLGLDLVRIGEFAWSRIEPTRDQLAFGWLDEAIGTLVDAGLEVVLGTPTATPPVWLCVERPDILAVGPDGRPRAYGSRRHTSPSSPAYREESRRIVTALVERYGEHPGIVAWQLDNEPGNHDSARCWSDASQAAFTAWLERRYGTIDALNEAWGAVFWSGEYPSFDAVRLPVPTVTAHTPALELAHRRFASDQAVEALAEQRAIVVAGAPGRDVYTNLYLGDVDVDARAVARPNGLAAIDLYPHGVEDPAAVGFLLDLARGTALAGDAGPDARGGRAWVTELQPGPVNWTGDNPAVPPGQVRRWSWQVALHGIEALLWFRWRAARAGQEQHHAALLRHDGTPDHGHAEVARFVRELAATDPARIERPTARVALLADHADAWLLQVVPHVDGTSHRDLVVTAHTAVRRLGMDVDVVPVDADLTGYDLVLAPGLHVTDDARVARLVAAADAGALVVLGPRSLVRDPHGLWIDRPVPGGLAAMVRVRVDHAGNPGGWPRGGPVSQVEVDGVTLPAGPWLETHLPLGADALGRDALGDDDTLGDEGASDGHDVEVLARAVGGPLDGEVVATRRGRFVLNGASSVEVWTALLASLTGRTPHPAHLDVFERDGAVVTIDHRTGTIAGLGPEVDG